MIRVFVGCASGDDIESQAVLEYSLRQHASDPVEIVWMQQSRDPASPFHGWRTEEWSTPFSGFRWLVPHLCGFEGRAIYTDSDVIFMADVAELWNQPFKPGKCVLAKGGAESWRFCVSLWDCAAAQPHMMSPRDLRSSPGAHKKMIQRFASAKFVQPFAGNWNCIDLEDHPSAIDRNVKLIHYSSEAHQPHLRYAVPRLAREGRCHWFDGQRKNHWRADLVALFDSLLVQAKAAGYTPERYAPPLPFGQYRIASHKHYASHKWARA